MRKKLTLGKDCKIAGVCSGLAQYLNMNVTIMRLIWAFSTLLLGSGVFLIYLTFYWVLPHHDEV